MRVYVVVTHYESTLPDGSRKEVRMFSSSRQALSYLKEHRDERGRSEIVDIPVIGVPIETGIVYMLHWYNQTDDSCNLEAVYGNRAEAENAIGEFGKVLRYEIGGEMGAQEQLYHPSLLPLYGPTAAAHPVHERV